MGSLSKLSLVTVASVVVFAASVTPARADIIVSFGVNNQGTDNVLLDPATNVGTVTGTFGSANRIVEFTQTARISSRWTRSSVSLLRPAPAELATPKWLTRAPSAGAVPIPVTPTPSLELGRYVLGGASNH